VNSLTRALRRSNLALKSSKQQLQKLSSTDPLTGCGNRRELFRRLEEEIRRSRRLSAPLACIALDVDHFKWINDGHGHPAGDLVLQAVSATLRQRLRGGDCLCRSGGEEFTLLLPGCPEPAAMKLAEELRLAIRNLRIPYADQSLQVSVSLGVTGLLDGRDDGESLLSRADRALYRAKQTGRDRVVLLGDG
jgi:diguanylate cyclase (GGDEF)-like protein